MGLSGNRLFSAVAFLLLPLFFFSSDAWGAGKEDVYQAPEVFIAESFEGSPPEPSVLWLGKDMRAEIASILGHEYRGLRVRYWADGVRTAWVLDEIGKVKPITTGIVVSDGRIERLKVLVYRESHGWEVKYPFFSDRFLDATRGERGGLSRPVDNISGATLSVNALKRLAELALYLDGQARSVSAQ